MSIGRIMETQLENRSPYRRDPLIHERIHDPYKTKSKLPEPAVCPICYAVFKAGPWQMGQFLAN
jgi:hypothetical protein